MTDSSVSTIAVVGGGASGTLAALHLIESTPLRVVLIDPHAEVGRGVAYSTPDPAHRLNVPAGKMSAFGDAPDHFVDWLRAGPLPAAAATTFAPRLFYGRYLAETLAARAAALGGRLAVVRGTATGIDVHGDAATVHVDGAPGVEADRVVLAVGHGSLVPLAALAGLPPDVLVADPWHPGALDAVRAGADVLFVGTGLTMVDVAVTLAGRGVASMTAVSRRGLVPRGHARPGAPRAEASVADAGSPTQVLRNLRAEAARTGDWRAAVDALRPDAAARWQAFSVVDRRSFLRHLRPYWDVHRHRTAPEVADVVDGLRASGRLRILAGRVAGANTEAGGARVTIRARGGGEASLHVHSVVACTGARPAVDAPVVRSLVAAGHARRDPFGLGLDTDADGALVGTSGEASGVLFTLGPLRQGTLWESTAVPEIRAQAARLAERLRGSQR